MNWNCAGCVHYSSCANKRVGCEQRQIHPEFHKYVDTMVNAYLDNEHDTMDELKAYNIDWYNEVMESMSCLI